MPDWRQASKELYETSIKISKQAIAIEKVNELMDNLRALELSVHQHKSDIPEYDQKLIFAEIQKANSSLNKLKQSKRQIFKMKVPLPKPETIQSIPFKPIQQISKVLLKNAKNTELNTKEHEGESIELQDCLDCAVKIGSQCQNVFLSGLTRCKVEIEHAISSVFIENCNDCEFLVKCHQLRIHESHNCRMKVDVQSQVCLENSDGFEFGWYNSPDQTNQWRMINDFSWLKSEPSPNFKLVE